MRPDRLRKQDRRQAFASLDGGFVRGAPRFEELHELPAGGIIVPFAVARDDFQQVIGGLAALATSVQCGSQVESRLMIERVGRNLLLEFDDRTE